MKERRDLEFRIFKEISKLSEIEFLGLLRLFNIPIVDGGPPKNRVKEEGSEETLAPRDFHLLLEDLGKTIKGLNRRQKKNLLRLLREATQKEKN